MTLQDITRSGFPKVAFQRFGNNFDLVSSKMPCEICTTLSILKNHIEDKLVCFKCYKNHEEYVFKEGEIIVNAFEKKKAELFAKSQEKGK